MTEELSTRIELRSGETLTLRPLRADGVEMLARYFDSLSEQTRKWFAPHEFTPEAALSPLKTPSALGHKDLRRFWPRGRWRGKTVSYTHLRAHET